MVCSYGMISSKKKVKHQTGRTVVMEAALGGLETAAGENGKPLLPVAAGKTVLGKTRFHLKKAHEQVCCEKVEDVGEFILEKRF